MPSTHMHVRLVALCLPALCLPAIVSLLGGCGHDETTPNTDATSTAGDGGYGQGGSGHGGSGHGGMTAAAGGTHQGGTGAGGQGVGGASTGGHGAGGHTTFEGTPLDHYTAGSFSEVSQIGTNLSGNTYNPTTDSHFLILNNNREIHELDSGLSHLRTIDLGGINSWDLEDIVYLGEGPGGSEYAVVSEPGRMWLGVIPNDGSTMLSLGGFQEIQFAPPPSTSNKGAEGVAYDPATRRMWACSERSPMIVYEFTRPTDTADTSYLDSLVVTQPFDAQAALSGHITDISSCMFDARTGRLLILSEQSSRVLDVDLSGNVHGELALAGAPQFEGLTLDDVGNLVITSEPNRIGVYSFMPE